MLLTVEGFALTERELGEFYQVVGCGQRRDGSQTGSGPSDHIRWLQLTEASGDFSRSQIFKSGLT